MYESYTHQSLPSKYYRELLGTALCVFNSNNNFVIENFLNDSVKYNWYDLIDKESGNIVQIVKTQFMRRGAEEIWKSFFEIVEKRNRIIHSFRITNTDGEQILATKDKKTQEQFNITEKYLINFIEKNDELSNELHEFRGY